MKDGMFKTGTFLFVVAAISGILLAFTQSLTAPVIAQNQLNAEIKAQNDVLPSKVFADITSTKDGKTLNYKVGFDNKDQITGAVFKVSPKGFGGIINIIVGINAEGKVLNYKILSLNETPGLGNKLKSKEFESKMLALLTSDKKPVFKVKKDGGDVDAITAATISSRAFCTGIREAQENFNLFKDEILSAKVPASSQVPQTQGGNQ